jgi:hypothetical protein
MMVTGTGTNYTKKHSRRGSVDKKDKIIIANSGDDIKEYVCPFCNFILHTRKVNGEVTCLHCQTEFTIEGTRRKSKIETPHKNTETLIPDPRTLYGGNNPGKSVSIHHEPDLQWGAKTLSQKGTIKFTSYNEK